jgi:hypothetical protein
MRSAGSLPYVQETQVLFLAEHRKAIAQHELDGYRSGPAAVSDTAAALGTANTHTHTHTHTPWKKLLLPKPLGPTAAHPPISAAATCEGADPGDRTDDIVARMERVHHGLVLVRLEPLDRQL